MSDNSYHCVYWRGDSYAGVICFCLMLGIVGSSITVSSAERFWVSGSVDYIVYDLTSATGAIKMKETREFLCEVDGCKWKIRTVGMGAPSGQPAEQYAFNNLVSYNEVVCDATNIYWLRKYSTNAVQRSLEQTEGGLQKPIEQAIANEGSVTIGILPVPSSSVAAAHVSSHVTPIWFAYASSCYLDMDRKSDRMRPIWALHESILNDPETYPRVELLRDPVFPRLPQHVEFFSIGVSKMLNANGTASRFALPAPYHTGYKMATYEVLASTNAGHLRVPLKSRFQLFAWKTGGRTREDISTSSMWEISAQKIGLAAPDIINKPSVSGKILVEDARLMKGGKMLPLHYLDTNRWLEPSDRRFGELAALAVRRSQRGASVRQAFWIALIVLTGFAIFAAVAKTRKQ